FLVFNGGPVEQDNLYFIHKIPDLIENSIEISNGIYWGGNFESTMNLINEGVIKDSQIRFFLGYSGWEISQLEKELISHSWVIAENVYKSEIIKKSANYFWKEKMVELGGNYLLWSNLPDDPNLN